MAATFDSEDILEGLDAIRCFWDPHMSKDYFYRVIRPHLDSVLFERRYAKRRKDKIARFYSYKNLVLALKIRLRKKGIV